MSENEIIVLDAELVSMLEPRAFRARLGNGHELTAFLRRGNSPMEETPLHTPGERVRVRMSPFDMSRGEIVQFLQNKATQHEGQNLGQTDLRTV